MPLHAYHMLVHLDIDQMHLTCCCYIVTELINNVVSDEEGVAMA